MTHTPDAMPRFSDESAACGMCVTKRVLVHNMSPHNMSPHNMYTFTHANRRSSSSENIFDCDPAAKLSLDPKVTIYNSMPYDINSDLFVVPTHFSWPFQPLHTRLMMDFFSHIKTGGETRGGKWNTHESRIKQSE